MQYLDENNKKWKHIVSVDIDKQPHVLFYDKKAGMAHLRRVFALGDGASSPRVI